MAHAGPPPMAGIPPPLIYQNMNYPLPVNHHIWGHNIRHPRECHSSYHINSRPMPSMNALHEEWKEYYLDRKAMIVAAGKSIEYVVGPDRNNGAGTRVTRGCRCIYEVYNRVLYLQPGLRPPFFF